MTFGGGDAQRKGHRDSRTLSRVPDGNYHSRSKLMTAATPSTPSSDVDDISPDDSGGGQRAYDEETHRVSVPKPQEGEKLGLTVQQQNKCVVVTRILSGGLVDQVGSYFCQV